MRRRMPKRAHARMLDFKLQPANSQNLSLRASQEFELLICDAVQVKLKFSQRDQIPLEIALAVVFKIHTYFRNRMSTSFFLDTLVIKTVYSIKLLIFRKKNISEFSRLVVILILKIGKIRFSFFVFKKFECDFKKRV